MMQTSFRTAFGSGFRCVVGFAVIATASIATAQHVPGTGKLIKSVGDDFEDEEWKFDLNYPKSSKDINRATNFPVGESRNERWYEGHKRGMPDYIRRVPTPTGGLSHSKGSLLLRSLFTGIHRSPSHEFQQDDFIASVDETLGYGIDVSRAPSVIARVYMSPFDKWERREGCTFAFRAALEPSNPPPRPRRSVDYEGDTFYPGFFIDFYPQGKQPSEKDYAVVRLRSNSDGEDYNRLKITRTGWWTFGMSFTPDGRVHYYARPDIENLTPQNRIASHYPGGLMGSELGTFFFNVCNGDDGKTWSTVWIVDDAQVWVAR